MIPRALGFGLHVVAWSRSLTPEATEGLGVGYKASSLEVAAAADIVSVHVALSAKTRGIIDAKFFDAMRPGAYFINTSRAEVVDQDALSRADLQALGVAFVATFAVTIVNPNGFRQLLYPLIYRRSDHNSA